MLLVTHHGDLAPRFVDEPRGAADDWYVWDPAANRMIDPLDGVTGQAVWTGSPDMLAAFFADGSAGLYDLTTHSRVENSTLELLDSGITTASRSADGTRFYLGYLDGRIQSFDSATGEEITPVIQTPGIIGAITASNDGARIAVAGFRDREREWYTTVHDATTGEQLGELPDIGAVRIAPDGTLVAGNYAGEITTYDLDTHRPLDNLPAVRSQLGSGGLHFSDDGRIMMASALDRTASIYDVNSRTRLGDPITRQFNATGGGVVSLRPDGLAVAFGGGGNGIVIWDLDPEHLATAACRLAGRNLTPTEWDTHLADLGDHRPTCPDYD
jgi:WD40 repeat protein